MFKAQSLINALTLTYIFLCFCYHETNNYALIFNTLSMSSLQQASIARYHATSKQNSRNTSKLVARGKTSSSFFFIGFRFRLFISLLLWHVSCKCFFQHGTFLFFKLCSSTLHCENFVYIKIWNCTPYVAKRSWSHNIFSSWRSK